MSSVFGTPEDDDMLVIDGMSDIDENPFYVPPTPDAKLLLTDVIATPHDDGLGTKLRFVFTVMSGPGAGKDISAFSAYGPNGSAATKQMWSLKLILKALGVDVTAQPLKFSPAKLVQERCQVIAAIEDNKYNGETRSQINVRKMRAA